MYNFSAGPGVLPKEVLLEAQKDFIDFKGSGISIIEASHRGKVYEPFTTNVSPFSASL